MEHNSDEMIASAKYMLSLYLKAGTVACGIKWDTTDDKLVGLIVDNIVLASVAKMTEMFMNSLDKKEKMV